MPIRSGLSNQVGMSKEVTYGTPVAPIKFLPSTSAKFQLKQNFLQGGGLYSGDFGPRAAQNVLGTVSGEGTLDLDVQYKDMGYLCMGLMGTVVTPVQQGATTAYLQTHTMADPFGRFFTVQTGITQITDGVTKPYTLTGTKVLAADFTFTPGDVVKSSWTLDAKQLLESTALASVSYTAAQAPYGIGTGINVKIGTVGAEASITGVTSATCKIDRKSKDDRYYLSAAGLKAEPILNSVSDIITGTLSMDFVDKTTVADLYAAGTTTSLVLEALGTNAGTAIPHTFRITVPGVKFMGDTPVVDGPDVINGDFPWTWVFDGTNFPKIEIIETATTL